MRRLCAALLGVLVLIGTAHAAPSKYMVTQDTMATSDTTLFKVYGKAQIDSATFSGMTTIPRAALDTLSNSVLAQQALTVNGKFTAGDNVADTVAIGGRFVTVGRTGLWGSTTNSSAIEFGVTDSTYMALEWKTTTGPIIALASNHYLNAANQNIRARKGIAAKFDVIAGQGTATPFVFRYAKMDTAGVAFSFTQAASFDTLNRWAFNGTTADSGGSFTSISTTGGARFDKGVNVAGDINPTTDNARDLGSAATSFDSLWIHVAATVGDMPWYDVDENGAPLNDVEAIRQIGTAGEIEPSTGRTLVDDATLPPQILVTHPDDQPARIDTLWTERQVPVDSTVASYTVRLDSTGKAMDAEPVYDVTYRTERTLVDVVEVPAHQRGDPVLSPDGKPYIDLRAAQGLTFGAVRQLADSLDVLRARIAELEAWKVGVEERLAKLESR